MEYTHTHDNMFITHLLTQKPSQAQRVKDRFLPVIVGNGAILFTIATLLWYTTR